MKNITKITQCIFLLVMAITAKAQFPLRFGDAVVTHSPNTYTASGPSTTPAVIRVIHTSNTLSAPSGALWATPGTKPPNDFYSNWNVNTLGYVFGITIDQNPSPNVYVSSTQIYSSSPLNMRKIWRLNGTSGANSLVFDFNNISGSGTSTSNRSLGNLKYGRFGTTENIYVSDWQTGEIQRVTGNSTSATLWSAQPAFNPKFGKAVDDQREMPYGLAIRKISATSVKLYYSKISTDNNSNSIGAYGNNEIYSVDLNPSTGAFIAGTEAIAIIPNINRNPESWGGYPPSGAGALGCTILPVIADIAFTANGKKMLLGQQSWGSFGKLAPHNSQVREFINFPLLSSSWINSTSLFPAGISLSQTCPVNTGVLRQTNCTGGVTYSDNILYKNQEYSCDTSVYFSSDYIQSAAGPLRVYGIQGMSASGGTSANSIWVDEDDDVSYYDKTYLGDVEVYKNPGACIIACNCQNSSWTNVAMGGSVWWSGPPAAIPALSYTQGQPVLSGVLFPNYNCGTSGCSATFTFTLLKPDGTSISLPNSSGALNLAQIPFANLPCDQTYYIVITPICGTSSCTPIRIPITYNCIPPPPSCDCKGTVTITASQQGLTVTPQNNTSTANPVSTVTGSFTLSASLPVTEVRMLVEEFRLTTTTGNENCQLCKNKPQSWASINAATLSGVTSQTAVSPTLSNDIREFVFNNGANTMFNLSGNTMNFTLGVPGITGLNCCKLKAEVCVKFIIRDVNCCEREVLKCFTFDLQ